ncbi:transposase [Mycobacterium avium]|uniref:transposase n=1 Tax=Mycobacterium avium TaxID=1764 RepID=UPI0027E0726A|nr:transposase [Mycobacterium avium]
MAVRLTAGQAGDNPQLMALLDDYAATCRNSDQSADDFRLLADKAVFASEHPYPIAFPQNQAHVPERRDQIDRRKAKGSAGGRPPAFDAEIYALRKTVERGFNRLKQWRGIATRYDKYALTYLGGVLLASASIWMALSAVELACLK